MKLMAIGGQLQRKRDAYVRRCVNDVSHGWRMRELIAREFERGWFAGQGYTVDAYVTDYIVRVRPILQVAQCS